jgi:hypothetical protein
VHVLFARLTTTDLHHIIYCSAFHLVYCVLLCLHSWRYFYLYFPLSALSSLVKRKRIPYSCFIALSFSNYRFDFQHLYARSYSTLGAKSIAPNGRPPTTLPEPIKRARVKDSAGSLARAMWLSGVSECERSEAGGHPIPKTRIQKPIYRPNRGRAC